MIQGKQKDLSAQIRTSDELSKLPHLDGISYEIVTAQDGRECILATGNTAVKKELLSAAGFPLEPTTENMVEICRIAEGAVLTGAALSVFLKSREEQ